MSGDSQLTIPLSDEEAHSTCFMCGHDSKAGMAYCDQCLADLRGLGAGFKPYVAIVRENQKTQPPKPKRARR